MDIQSDTAMNCEAEKECDAARLQRAGYELGRDDLGPVIASFLRQLHLGISHFQATRGAKPLFVSRAGVRIRRLLEAYMAATGAAPLGALEDFWISRLMVAKGVWRRSPALSLQILDKEFKQRRAAEFVAAMLRREAGEKPQLVKDDKLSTMGGVSQFIAGGEPTARQVIAHFDRQSALFEQYLKETLVSSSSVVLIDTGWQATAQRLLTQAFGDIDWWGLYFGRSGFADTDRSVWSKAIGLVFESDRFELARPETSIVLHRHMIESLFEARGPSIEHLAPGADGRVGAPDAPLVLADEPTMSSDPIYIGVLDHIRSLGAATGPAEIVKNARAAALRVARLIAFPSREEARLYESASRSADFGRDLSVSVLHPPTGRSDQDSVERRIREALWPAAQAAIEFGEGSAVAVQRRLAGVSREEFSEQAAPLRKPRKALDGPRVAVITRTKDRLLFLKRALESVSAQTYRNYVHVVVNDGGDAEAVRRQIELAPVDKSRIILVDNVVNRGMEAASNVGIKAVDSEFIVIHDDDDSWLPEFLGMTTSFLDDPANRRYGGVITKSTYVSESVDGDSIRIHKSLPYQGWVDRVDLMEMAIGNFFPPIAFLFRREVYDQIGGFNENYPVLGDWEFNLQFLARTDVGVVPQPLANYHHRDTGDVKTFGNTVIAERDKHASYSSIVRNSLLRGQLARDNPAIAQLIGLGLHFGELRGRVRNAEHYAFEARAGGAPKSAPTGDLVAIERTAETYYQAFAELHRALTRADFSALARYGLSPFRALARRLLGRASALSADAALERVVSRIEADMTSPRPDFDESAYLAANPDVAQAVAKGQIESARRHYLSSGCAEGRQRKFRLGTIQLKKF